MKKNNELEVLIANKDILCYKLIRKTYRWGIFGKLFNLIRYETPFIQFDVTNAIKYKLDIIPTTYGKVGSHEGWIHTYATLSDVILRPDFLYLAERGIKVFECYIPGGTRYCIQDNNQYSSDRIVPLRELSDSESYTFYLSNYKGRY